MDPLTIFIGVMCVFTLWMCVKGDAIAEEAEYHCYEVNELLRAKKGKPPIPWRGSMKKYLKDEKAELTTPNPPRREE